jgi:drug/metabolite transporter (DMT)-like permease
MHRIARGARVPHTGHAALIPQPARRMTHKSEKLGLALGFAGVLLFGGTLPATRLAVGSIDPLLLTAARATIAGCAGLALLVVLRRPWPSRAMMRMLIVTGLCTIVGFPVLMALAMANVPAAHGGVVLGIVPLATAAAAALVAHERPSAGFWLASLAGAGIVVVFMTRHSDAGSAADGLAVGDLFLLGTVVAGAFGYALSGRLSQSMPGWEVISWQVAMFLPLSALASWALWPTTLADVPAPAWAGLAYVSLVSQFSAFFVFNAGMAMGGVARVGQLMLLQPFAIVALAAPVNGEPIRLSTLLYAAAVVAVVIVGQRMRVKRA